MEGEKKPPPKQKKQNLPEEPPLMTSKVMMGNAPHEHPESIILTRVALKGMEQSTGKKIRTTNYVTHHTRYSRDRYLFFSMTIGKKPYSQHL